MFNVKADLQRENFPWGSLGLNWSFKVVARLELIIVIIASVSITPLINSPAMVTLAITPDLSTRSSGDS
uniref:Uncharacterized protein n=1 Tax=Glossina palpalis gambiensis TaxID=67801 RepID=A0A1B0BPY1_9MUSC